MANQDHYVDYTLETDVEFIILRRYRDGSLYMGTTEDNLQAVGRPSLRWWLKECLQALAESEED